MAFRFFKLGYVLYNIAIELICNLLYIHCTPVLNYYCTFLNWTELHCTISVLYWSALHCTALTLHCTLLHCSTLYFVTLQFNCTSLLTVLHCMHCCTSTVYQALRICVELSSETIHFLTHQFELIYHKIFFKTNRINSLLTKSLRNFFKDIFLLLCAFNGFAPQKPLFLDLHEEQVFPYIQFKCITCKKKWPNQQFFVKKVLKWLKMYFS